jgi:hypothetical protein
MYCPTRESIRNSKADVVITPTIYERVSCVKHQPMILQACGGVGKRKGVGGEPLGPDGIPSMPDDRPAIPYDGSRVPL